MSNGEEIIFYDEYWAHQFESEERRLKSEVRHNKLRTKLQQKDQPLLVVGCGGAGEMSIIPAGVTAVGIDISSMAVRKSKKVFPGHDYVIADATCLPFSPQHFQQVVCSEVIEHIRDEDIALREFNRVLKSGGKLLLTTPNWQSFYGIARFVVEAVFSVDVTSGDQPYDRWTTKKELNNKLVNTCMSPCEWSGLWYFPPFGRGERYRVPEWLTIPLIKLFLPIDRILGSHLPAFGHIILVIAIKI